MTIELTPDEHAAVEAAAQLPPIEYGRTRSALAKKLKCGVAYLDEARAAIRGNGRPPGDKQQGAVLAFSDPEPWPAPVDGADLLDELAATFRRFLALPKHADTTLALWTMFAQAHDAAQISPVLAITSPAPECGKTNTLQVAGALAPRPLPTSNVTPAALFRAVEKYLPTLLIDEADTFIKNSDELRGVLNSGHSRRSAFVVRTVGDDHEPATFRTWSPKAIAMIGKLPATLASRSIEIRMRRRTRTERGERLRLDRLVALEPLRRRAWTWAQMNLDALRAADPAVPEALNDRAADNWRPLLAIADRAGGEWPARARAAALVLSGGLDDEAESVGVALLQFVRDLFVRRGVARLPTAEIVRAALADDEAPTGPHGRDLDGRDVGRLFRPFGVRPRKVRDGDRVLQGYRVEDLEEAFSRYLPPDPPFDPEQPVQCSPDAEKSPFSTRNTGADVPHAESGESALPMRVVPDVPDEQGGLWGERVE